MWQKFTKSWQISNWHNYLYRNDIHVLLIVHAYKYIHLWSISSWAETRNLNYIWKTLDVIDPLRSGWRVQYIEKQTIFEQIQWHFQRLCGHGHIWVHFLEIQGFCNKFMKKSLGIYGSWSITIATISVQLPNF